MEIWDVYDDQRRPTGRTHIRGRLMAGGENHIAVGIIVFNRKGEILLTRRCPEKRIAPGQWENTVGSVLAGEDSLSGAVRELREETGIEAEEDELFFLHTVNRRIPHCFMDVYLLYRDIDLSQLVLQPGETCEARWVRFRQWESMLQQEHMSVVCTDDRGVFLDQVRRYMSYCIHSIRRKERERRVHK